MSGKTVLILIVSLLFAFKAAAQQKYALVIGNGNYVHQWGRLNNPINDATDVSEALKSLDFNVEYIADGNRSRILTALTNLKNRLSASQNSYGVFYFAGHGYGEYLIPVDAEFNKNMLPHQALPVPYILKELEDASNVFNLIVLDACRNLPEELDRSGNRGLFTRTHPHSGSIVVYSTLPGQTADDGTGRNSPFTSQLLKHIRTPGIDVLTMLNRTNADVVSSTSNRQIPQLFIQYHGTAYLGSRPNNNVPVPPPPPPPPIRSLYDQLVNAAGTTTITVTQDTELPPSTVISQASSIMLRGDTAGRTVLGNGSNYITIKRGVTLTLENITLRGVGVTVDEGGMLVMNTASTITGCDNNGVAVFGRGAFTMNGGSITNNRGSGVDIHHIGGFTMNGGTISGNTFRGVTVGGNFTMNNGSINNNTTASTGMNWDDFGGGVFVDADGTFNMSGGTISGNSAANSGGGVWVLYRGVFIKTGGTISNTNKARFWGNVWSEFGLFSKTRNTTAGPSDNVILRPRS